ncbi:MAG: tetratricopeptide repeat protein [Bacteroidetes bacterium]|nr:tetratricopeptide repeat protein [Bacteroidota bacterium]
MTTSFYYFYSMVFLRLFLITLFISFPVKIWAEFEFNNRCQLALKEAFALRTASAATLLDEEKKANPANLVPLLVEDYLDFFTLFLGEGEKDYKNLRNNRDLRLRILEKEGTASPYALYCRAEIHLHWSLIRLKRGEWTGGATELNKAFRLLKENQQQYPAFLPNVKSLGLIHSVFGAVPPSMTWVTRLLDMEGTLDQGIAEIHTAFDGSLKQEPFAYLKEEAVLYLIFMEINNVYDKKRIEIFSRELQDKGIPDEARKRPLLAYAYATFLLKTGRNDEACKLLISFPKAGNQLPFYYLDYLTGICLLNKLDTNAAKYFRFYLSRYKGQSNIKSSWQHLAWIELLKGNREGYLRKMSTLQFFGKERVEADKQAEKEARGKIVPNLALLQARLLFDGGYYRQARNILSKPVFINMRATSADSLEYIYRLGRIEDEMGFENEAVRYYEKTIAAGIDQPFYYAGNACLMLGLLYEQKQQYTKAMAFYRQCLKIDSREYRNSIQNKARAGLARVEKKL